MVTFETGKKTDSFTGAVVDKITGDPIKNVDITVGGSSTTTDVTGYFRVEAPLTDRYVLNMTKRGYALRSCIVYADLSGQRWGMVATKDTLFDPTRELVLVDNRAILKKKERRGATVRVPADALVDASGNKPTGMLTGSIATYDITDSESPGDWGAIDEFGKEKNLLSYGAAWVEFMDAAGTKFNLAPGREAEVDMPGPGGMMASGPATSKFWRYDEKDGYWKVSGKSVRKPFGYVGRIDHFSAVNSDVESTNPACMKILIYPDIPTGSQLRLKDATGTNISQCFDLFGLQAGLNAVYRLPPNIDLTLELYTASGTAISDFVVQVDFVNQPGHVANTGPPMPAGADWWPPEPYETCKLVVLLRDVVTSGRQFLTINGRDGGLNAVQNEAQTQAYYNGIDPNHERETLGAWWTKNGFVFGAGTNQPPTNADVRRTSYLNYNDLGSGRDMYFRPLPGGNVAAYVTNYGAFDQDPDNARAAAVNDPAKRGATVCMEFSPVEGRGAGEDRSIVKFYVYKPIPGDPEWAHDIRATSANLDTYGEKFVPNLCINCHGEEPYNLAIGAVPTFEDLDVAASFRELDYATYKFRLDDGATHPTLAEQQAFKDQNLIIRNAGSAIASQPIKDLITGWYASGTPAQDNSYTPPNWIGAPQQGLYHDVVATSCRTCHIALQEDLNWNEYSEFELGNAAFNLRYTVLCEGRYMPHAAITYRNFWLSAVPHRPEELRTFQKLPDWPRIGQCDAP